jgi:large subunit ribosomal protein L32
MAVPKKRTSRSRRGQRRAHDAIRITAAVEACGKCGELKQRHQACPNCGAYRTHQIEGVKAQ